MKQVTKKELFEIITERLSENDIFSEDTKFKCICLNGIKIYYTHYEAGIILEDEDNDFYIQFYDNDGLCCAYRSYYEMDYIYFDYNLYEII